MSLKKFRKGLEGVKSPEDIARLGHDTLEHKSLANEFAFLQGIYKMKFQTEYKKSIYLADDTVGPTPSPKTRAKKYRYYL